MTGPMLAWLARHEPATLARAAAVLLPKDALRAALVPGAAPAVTDRSDASATLLWDVPGTGGRRPRSPPPGSLRSCCRRSGRVPRSWGRAATSRWWWAAPTPRSRCWRRGSGTGLQVNLGTGVQVLRPGAVPRPADDPVVHCYADAEDGWYAMAALQNGGSAWAWVCGVLGLSWSEFFDAAAAVPAGAGGVRLPAVPHR